MKPWTAEQYPLETIDKAPTEDKIILARKSLYRACKECGVDFMPKSITHTYCSEKCRNKQSTRLIGSFEVIRECEVCGNKFSASSKSKKKFCSKSCRIRALHPPVSKECEECGQIFISTSTSTKEFCSSNCRREYRLAELGILYKLPKTSTDGSLGKALATADLLRRGYHVFENVSHFGPCDLVAIKEAKVVRVEVKSSSVIEDLYSYKNTRKSQKGKYLLGRDFDVFSFISYDGKIEYFPEGVV